ncbi:hypothetical protein HGA91_04035 [candidate division WWE3 bacterium]|nr:hypothetical protein [candidate division WWE3 bacterium]
MSQASRTVVVVLPTIPRIRRWYCFLSIWQKVSGHRLICLPAHVDIHHLMTFLTMYPDTSVVVLLDPCDDLLDRLGSVVLSSPILAVLDSDDVHVRYDRLPCCGGLEWISLQELGPSLGCYTDVNTAIAEIGPSFCHICVALISSRICWARYALLLDHLQAAEGVLVVPVLDVNVNELVQFVAAMECFPNSVAVLEFGRRSALREVGRIVPGSTKLILVMERVNYSDDWTKRYIPLLSMGHALVPSYIPAGRFEDSDAWYAALGLV